MEIVADSNILFSALISGKSVYLDIFRIAKVYVPDFIFLEIEKYEKRIIKKTKLKNTFRNFVRDLFTEVTVIPIDYELTFFFLIWCIRDQSAGLYLIMAL